MGTLERECLFSELIASNNSSLRVIRRVLETCTKDGCISRKRMKKLMTEDEDAVEALQQLEINSQVLDGVMKLLDENDTGIVCLDDFVLAIMQLHAPANLVATMMYTSKRIAVRFQQLQQRVDENFAKMTYVMSTAVRSSRCI